MAVFELLINECEALIRSGRIESAAKKLARINYATVPRQWRLPLANLCRRSKLLKHGLRLLKPVMYQEYRRAKLLATPAETAEYALLLERSGASNEAQALLAQIDVKMAPEALFALASVHVARWEYQEAKPCLEQFMKNASSEYARLIARVNLAAVLLVTDEVQDALKLIDLSLCETERTKNFRLYANCLELRAQAHILCENYSAAQGDLLSASSVLGISGTDDELYIQKWRAVVKAVQSQSVRPLVALRGQAVRRKSWETVRDIDFQMLKVKFNEDRFNNLLFGTPSKAYRMRIKSKLNYNSHSSFYTFGHKSSPEFNLMTGEFRNFKCRIKPGKKEHQLLDVLCRDFYAPVRIGTLFSGLFPGDRFDVFSSPERVRQIICRTRQWLILNEIPIDIEEEVGLYRLKILGNFGIVVPFERVSVEFNVVQLNRLRQMFPCETILASREIRRVLDLSLSSFQRFMTWGMEVGALQRLGHGSATVYCLISKSESPMKAA